MRKLWDSGIKKIDELLAGPYATAPHCMDRVFKASQRRSIVLGFVFNDADRSKAAHVEGFALRVEFFKVLLTGRIAFKEIDGPLALRFELAHPRAGFVLACTFHSFITATCKIAHGDLAKGKEVFVWIELREKEVTIFTQERGHEAELARFLGRDKVAAHIARRRERLVFFHATIKAVKEASVGEGDVRKARRGDRHCHAAAHEEILHDALGCAHHVDRIGGLVRRHAKVLARSHRCCLAHRLVGIEDIHLDHAHERVRVLFAAYMLERGQIEHIVVAKPVRDKRIEDVAPCIDGK